jgi:hypothetical protein
MYSWVVLIYYSVPGIRFLESFKRIVFALLIYSHKSSSWEEAPNLNWDVGPETIYTRLFIWPWTPLHWARDQIFSQTRARRKQRGPIWTKEKRDDLSGGSFHFEPQVCILSGPPWNLAADLISTVFKLFIFIFGKHVLVWRLFLRIFPKLGLLLSFVMLFIGFLIDTNRKGLDLV